ncbi:uncharacterized protein LOC116026987 [Ipomoea triloba]|uniref:uncharacterized protein LOC116026987 n=1 Tax=Ipomoea triloba TaxID=35885 RepID=UPI00125E8067|nr:uncharacterized protein LOC116026987 [Ipomoea triloba]
MTSRRISGFDSTPSCSDIVRKINRASFTALCIDVGEEGSVFTLKLHIGGDLVWHPKIGYRDGGVEYFDHFNCHEDIVSLVGEVPPNKEVVIYVEHLFDDQWDYDVEISRELGDDCLLYDEIEQSTDNEVEVEVQGENECETDGENEVQCEEEYLMDTGTSSKQGAGLEGDEFHEVECELSEELFRSLENSEESDGEVTAIDNVFQQTNLNKEGFKFEIGMIFKSADEFKWAVKCHEATRRKDIYFKKNEGRRVRMICRHNNTCNWSIFASRSNPRNPFAIKTYTPEHTCGDQDENRTVNSGFLAKLYKDDFKINTEWGRIQFQEHVKAKLKCQFKLLNSYCEELKRSNPGTSVKMKVDGQFSVNGRPRFVRLYICYAACKEGFLRGCRPFLGLDGCHLKGPQKGGQLLSAVGVDGYNRLYPIAFAIVEGELKDSWLWFLEQLDNDLNISSNPGAWTVISDKQKGLIPAIEERFPGMEHRFCVRHMHANFVKDGFTGHVLKQKLWAVCKATTEPEYKRQMEELKALNAKAAEWLDARDAKHYCKAYFSTFPKTDLLLNNLCESWNSTILNFRDKPVLSMCEKLRIYLMTRMQKNRESIKSHTKKICPKICKLLEEEKDRACRYSTYKSNDNFYQVDDENFRCFKVDLINKQCSCRRWDLTGIPCSHAIAAVRKQRESPEDYVHQCYTVDSYLKAYEPAIQPILSSELWPKTNLPDPLPPKYKAQPGRPKKKRKINPIEESKKDSTKLKARKVGEVKRCSVAEMEEIVAGMEQVVAEEELRNSQPSQAVQNQAPSLSEFISAQLPSESSTPNVITRSGKNYVTVATLQQSKAVQRETRKKRTTAKKK